MFNIDENFAMDNVFISCNTENSRTKRLAEDHKNSTQYINILWPNGKVLNLVLPKKMKYDIQFFCYC